YLTTVSLNAKVQPEPLYVTLTFPRYGVKNSTRTTSLSGLPAAFGTVVLKSTRPAAFSFSFVSTGFFSLHAAGGRLGTSFTAVSVRPSAATVTVEAVSRPL